MFTYYDVKNRFEKHQYKRGQYKGDAPADPSRRAKTHFRIIKDGDVYYIRFHYTNILTFYPNGDVTIRTNGYINSPTTRAAFAEYKLWISTEHHNGYSNPVVYQSYDKPHVPFVEGMRYNTVTGEYIHPDAGGTFTRKKYVADRAARKKLRDHMKAHFLPILPILLAAAAQQREGMTHWERHQQHRAMQRSVEHDPACVTNPENYADLAMAYWAVEPKDVIVSIMSDTHDKLRHLVTF